MQRAARATREIAQARFTANASFETPLADGGATQGSLEANGRMTNGGEQLQFTVAADIAAEGPHASHWTLRGEVIVAGEKEVYVKMHEWSTDPAASVMPAPNIATLLGAWFKLPEPEGSGAPRAITPDPRFLRMQTDTVDVTHDRGRRARGGRTVYEYDVAVNREKLIAFLEAVAHERAEAVEEDAWRAFAATIEATGVLTIDAQTFHLQGVQWTIQSAAGAKPFTLTMDVRLSDINDVEPIAPPQGAIDLPESPFQGMPDLLRPQLPPA